jgi:spore maturation protein CgeB
VRVDCFGPGWEKRSDLASRLFRRGRNHGYGTFLEVRDTIASSVVSLNLANASQHGADQQIKGRHFEIPALGACQVTTPAAGIERYFEPGREIVVAEEGPALAEAVRGLLRDRPRARAIAEAGWARTWAEHTWERRIDGILEAAGLSG